MGQVFECAGHSCDMRVCVYCMTHLVGTIPGMSALARIGPNFRMCKGCAEHACAPRDLSYAAEEDGDGGDDDYDDDMKGPELLVREGAGARR